MKRQDEAGPYAVSQQKPGLERHNSKHRIDKERMRSVTARESGAVIGKGYVVDLPAMTVAVSAGAQ